MFSSTLELLNMNSLSSVRHPVLKPTLRYKTKKEHKCLPYKDKHYKFDMTLYLLIYKIINIYRYQQDQITGLTSS